MNENGDTVVTELLKILLEDCKRQEEVMEERRRLDESQGSSWNSSPGPWSVWEYVGSLLVRTT